MEDYLYGRYTTLNDLKKRRDDTTKPYFIRERAARAMNEIIEQLKDKKLMALRERLIKAARAGDKHEEWKIANLMREHEGRETEEVE